MFFFLCIEDRIEFSLCDFHYNVTKHLDESSVAVICETRIFCQCSQSFYRLIVQTQVQDGVHHTRHGDLST